MARHNGGTRKLPRKKHMGHRVHKRTRAARRERTLDRHHARPGWSPSMQYVDELGTWV